MHEDWWEDQFFLSCKKVVIKAYFSNFWGDVLGVRGGVAYKEHVLSQHIKDK